MFSFVSPRPAARPVCAPALAALALLAGAQAHAFIKGIDSTTAPNGNSELVFMAWDNNSAQPKVAFIKDLGTSMDSFFVSGQQDAGVQKFWYLGGTGTGIEGDAAWTTFLNTDVSAGVKVDASKVKWAVFALDGDLGGSYVPDDYKLFTTVKQATSGSATVITGLSNVTTQNLIDKPPLAMGTFLGGANQQAGHTGTANENGSAVVTATQGDSVFPFVNGTTPNIGFGYDLTFNGAINASAGNLVGQSSWFYKVSRNADEFDASLPVVIDEFDNLGGDGYWGLAAATGATRTGQYFLSYTLKAFVSAQETASGLTYGNSFARMAGVLSLSSPAGKGETVLDLTTNFVRNFAQSQARAAGAEDNRAFATSLRRQGALLGSDLEASLVGADLNLVTAVPEPGTWALWGAGLGLLGWLQKTRRQRA